VLHLTGGRSISLRWEAAVRRAERDRAAAQRPPESGRRSGELDPIRYGDWEVKGIATDF